MDDARAEAERRWPHDGGVTELALSRARYRVGFRKGAKWQAEQSATRIAELEAEVEQVKADAWDEGFDAGERDVFEHEHTSFDAPCIRNPYRKDEDDEQ